MHLGKKVHCERCDDQIGGGNFIQANSNECDSPAKTDFRLVKHEKLDKSELCHAGNCIEVSCHNTGNDNIKMEVPDEIATDKEKIILKED